MKISWKISWKNSKEKLVKCAPKLLACIVGDSHDGQIDVCRLVAMVIWSWTWNVANRDQTCLWGRPRQTRLGHVHVHDYRRGTFVLCWNDERIVVYLKRVGSSLSISYKVTHFYASQPTDEHNRDAFACNPTTHDWLRLSWMCPWPSKICPSCEWPIRFLYKVVNKISRLRKFNRSREIEFNFVTAWTISMKLGTLVHHVYGYKLPQIF